MRCIHSWSSQRRRNEKALSSNLCIPLKSCLLRLIITFSDTNYKVQDGFLCRPRRARKYICPTIARYLLAADIRFVLSPGETERLRAEPCEKPSSLFPQVDVSPNFGVHMHAPYTEYMLYTTDTSLHRNKGTPICEQKKGATKEIAINCMFDFGCATEKMERRLNGNVCGFVLKIIVAVRGWKKDRNQKKNFFKLLNIPSYFYTSSKRLIKETKCQKSLLYSYLHCKKIYQYLNVLKQVSPKIVF